MGGAYSPTPLTCFRTVLTLKNIKVSYTISMRCLWAAWNRAKLTTSIATDNSYLYLNHTLLEQWPEWNTRHKRAILQHITMFRAIKIPSFRIPSKCWNMICYRPRHFSLTFTFSIITCSGRRNMALLGYTWLILKRYKIDCINGFGPKMRRFISTVFIHSQRDSKSALLTRADVSNKQLFENNVPFVIWKKRNLEFVRKRHNIKYII